MSRRQPEHVEQRAGIAPAELVRRVAQTSAPIDVAELERWLVRNNFATSVAGVLLPTRACVALVDAIG